MAVRADNFLPIFLFSSFAISEGFSWKYINQAEALQQAAEETDQENPPFSGLDSFVPVMSARQAEWLHGTG